MSKNVGLLL